MTGTLQIRLSQDANHMISNIFDLVPKATITREDKTIAVQVQGKIIFDFSEDVQNSVVILLEENET